MQMRRMEFEGAWKNVMVRLPITLCEKLEAAVQGKHNVGREIRKRLESTFSPGCPLAQTESTPAVEPATPPTAEVV